MGGARESFGGSGVIVLADDGRLAAESTGNRRLATLEGIDHIHLRGRTATTVREQTGSAERTGKRKGKGDVWRRLQQVAEGKAFTASL